MIYNILSNKSGQSFKHTIDGSLTVISASAYDPNNQSIPMTAAKQTLTNGVSVDAYAGDNSFIVDSLSGLRLNTPYVVKNSVYEQLISISKIDITTKEITLYRPLQQDFASGSLLSSPTVTFSFTSTLQFNIGNRIELHYHDFYGDEHIETIPFNSLPYHLKSDASIETVAALDGQIVDKLSIGTNFDSLKEATWDMVVTRVHANKAVGTLVGTVNLTNAHSFLILAQMAQGAGPEYLEYRNSLLKRFEEELVATLSAIQTFGNEQGQTKQRDWFKTVEIVRA